MGWPSQSGYSILGRCDGVIVVLMTVAALKDYFRIIPTMIFSQAGI
jgi:hypothetical protein